MGAGIVETFMVCQMMKFEFMGEYPSGLAYVITLPENAALQLFAFERFLARVVIFFIWPSGSQI
jgi:hypothetical protein